MDGRFYKQIHYLVLPGLMESPGIPHKSLAYPLTHRGLASLAMEQVNHALNISRAINERTMSTLNISSVVTQKLYTLLVMMTKISTRKNLVDERLIFARVFRGTLVHHGRENMPVGKKSISV